MREDSKGRNSFWPLLTIFAIEKWRSKKSLALTILLPSIIGLLLVIARQSVKAQENRTLEFEPFRPDRLIAKRFKSSNDFKILYTPKTELTENLVNMLKKDLEENLLEYDWFGKPVDNETIFTPEDFPDELSMRTYVSQIGTDLSQIFVGLSFEAVGIDAGLEFAIHTLPTADSRGMPVKGMWNGWLTQKSSASVLGKSFGNSLFSDFEARSRANQIYHTEGFLAVQSSIYKNFLKLTGEEKIPAESLEFLQQESRTITSDRFHSVMQQQLPLMFLLSLAHFMQQTVQCLSSHQEASRLKYLKMLGISSHVIIAAFFSVSLAMYAAGTGVLSLLLTSPITESGAVLEYVHFSTIFVLLLCYGCAVLALCQLISKLFKQSHSAASAASAIIFFLSIPHGYIFTSWKDMSVLIKCLISLNPPVLLALGCDIICFFEKLNLPVSLLTNMNRQVSLDDTIALADICNLLLLNMFFYLSVTWFVDTSGDERNRVFENFFGINLNHEKSRESSRNWGFRVENVSKNFESKAALSNVSFVTPAEGVTALIGTNGAGKSTMMKLLAGFLSPSRGEVHDAGIEVGYCPQYNVTWPGLTVKEHFIYFNKLAGGNGGVDPNEIARNVQLEEKQNARPEELSGGMLRKLTFGVAMSSNPRRILLDEPTSGLDPVSRLELWEIVKQLGQKTAVLLTTHYMDEVNELAQEVIIMRKGEVVRKGKLADVRCSLGPTNTLSFNKNPHTTIHQIKAAFEPFGTIIPSGNKISVSIKDQKRLPAVLRKIKKLEEEKSISNVRPISPSLDNLFSTDAKEFEEANHAEIYAKIKAITKQPSSSVFYKFLHSLQKCFVLALREIRILALQLVIPCAMVIATVNQLGNTTDRLDQPKIFFSDVLDEISMSSESIELSKNSTTLYFPGEHYHSAPAALFWQQRNTMRQLSISKFSLAHAPFHVHRANQPVAKGPGLYFAGVTLVYNCIIGLMMTAAPFGMNAVSERVTGFKFMQELVGLPRKIFWAGHYFLTVAKFGVLLFLTVFLTSFFTASHEDLDMLSENYGALLMLLFGFILSHTPISFIIGRFSSDSAKFVGDHCNFNVLVTMFTFLTVLTIRLFDDKDLSNKLNYVFMLIPSHNFAMGLFDLYVNENLRRFCVGDFPEYGPRQVCEAGLVDMAENIWSFEYLAVGKYIVMQFCLIPVYFGILAYLETPKKLAKIEKKDDGSGLKIENLRKGKILKDASFEIKQGNTMCLLGPNGAGKTTLVKILCGLTDYDDGSITISGRKFSPTEISVCPQFDHLMDKLTVRETLAFLCYSRGIYDLSVIEHALNLLGIGKFTNTQNGALSGGTKRKLSVACTLINNPDLFILDEPTCGLDPSSRIQMKKIYEVLQKDEKTVLVATHTIEECLALQAGVTFLSSGQVKFQSADVSASLAAFSQTISLTAPNNCIPKKLADFCKSINAKMSRKKASNDITVEIPTTKTAAVQFWELLLELKEEKKVDNFHFSSPDLQKLFLNILQ